MTPSVLTYRSDTSEGSAPRDCSQTDCASTFSQDSMTSSQGMKQIRTIILLIENIKQAIQEFSARQASLAEIYQTLVTGSLTLMSTIQQFAEEAPIPSESSDSGLLRINLAPIQLHKVDHQSRCLYEAIQIRNAWLQENTYEQLLSRILHDRTKFLDKQGIKTEEREIKAFADERIAEIFRMKASEHDQLIAKRYKALLSEQQTLLKLPFPVSDTSSSLKKRKFNNL